MNMATEKKGSLNDLGLSNTSLEGASFDDIPENIGIQFPDPPQPGKYRFKLPASLNAVWAVVDSEKFGQRINAVFDGDSTLTIVQSPDGAHNGEEFTYRISNVPRERTKEKILVSDMDLLLRALGETARPKTNKAYALALQKYAGHEFGATEEYSWNCNPKRAAYWENGSGGAEKVLLDDGSERTGCGQRYYQRDVPKVEGRYPVRLTCSNTECGASVRAFPNLGGFTK